MSVHEMFQWWNVIYAAPLAIAVLWVLMTAFSGMHGHGFEHGHDLGHGVGDGIGHGHLPHDIGHALGHAMHHGDASGHAHAEGGSAHGHAHSHDHDSDGDRGGANEALNVFCWVLGIGQIPVTLVLASFMLSWGAFGLMFNQIFHVGGRFADFTIWPSILSTFGLSFVITRSMVAILARALPKTETFGVSRIGLTGTIGRVIHVVGEKAGTVDISDQYGTVHRVQAKTEDDTDSIPIGTQVVVLDFDDDDKRFIVRKSTL